MQIHLPPTPVSANRPGTRFSQGVGGGTPSIHPGPTGPEMAIRMNHAAVLHRVTAHTLQAEREHQADLDKVNEDIDQKIKREGGQNVSMDVNTPNHQLESEKNILVKLYYTEDQHTRAQSEHAGMLYEGNSLTDRVKQVHNQIIQRVLASPAVRDQLLNNWAAAHTAARKSQIHAETARRLREKESQLNAILAEQARRMAEAAAQAHAQAVAEEQARRQAAEAAERERLAAEAEAARTAEAAGRARLEAEAEAARAAEQAKEAAQAEVKRLAQAQAGEVATNTDTQNAGTLAITQPTIITASGAIALSATATATVQAAVRSAIAAISGAAASVASGVFVGVSALIYSPKLGNGELPEGYAFSTPLADLLPGQDLESSLNTIAVNNGSINLPHRLGSMPSEDGQEEIVLAKTHGTTLPSDVRVFAATYGAEQNAYIVTTDDLPPRIFVWTPIVKPDTSSTISPAESPTPPIYIGTTLIPANGQLDVYPDAGQIGFRDIITVFPADSGIDPIYTMFSNPYEGATVRGVHSGRMYNPENTGGPIQNLSWENATITQAGIDLVKLHTGRFEVSAGNSVMIDRLNKILTGEIESTDVDKRFYTHEIRELERYRALGVEDGVEGHVWNDAHAATLEDFRLKDNPDLLYTPEATDAYLKQEYGE